MVEEENDKPTVIALREIADGLVDGEKVDLIQAEIEAAEGHSISTWSGRLNRSLTAPDRKRHMLATSEFSGTGP